MKKQCGAIIRTIACLLCCVLLSSCAKVKVDGKTIRLNDPKCSIALEVVEELPYEGVKDFADEDNPDLSYWHVSFSHNGDHGFSSLTLNPEKGGFAPSSEFAFVDSEGSSPEILGGNIGLSNAYLALQKGRSLKSAKAEHKGWEIAFDFASGTWSYAEK